MKNDEILFSGKKAFTLLEVIISISIFMIILIFLYKVLDDTKLSNKKFEKHIYKNEEINYLYKIISEDIAESRDGKVKITLDRDNNAIVEFKSNNTFNNPYYSYITYLISSSGHLSRIESKKPFEKEKSGIEFYDNSFIDILLEGVSKFVVIYKETDQFIFIIEPKEKEKIMFSTFKMMED